MIELKILSSLRLLPIFSKLDLVLRSLFVSIRAHQGRLLCYDS